MSLAHAATNPFRSPDWKWQRAMAIVEGRGPPATRRRDTVQGFKWIRRAVRYIQARRQQSSDGALQALAEAQPDLFWAHEAWNAVSSVQKDSLEAHILARESNFEVAARYGMTPDVVAAYEALFFNVRERLDHKQYILHCVLGFADDEYAVRRETDLWKLYGYFLGPHMLDAVETRFVNPLWCHTPDNVGAAITDDAIGTLKLKADMATKKIQVTPATQLSLIEHFTKFVEVERTTDTVGKAQEQVLSHIAATFSALPLVIGKNQVLDADDQTAAELTYSERMQRLAGRAPLDLEQLQEIRFPDEPPLLLHQTLPAGPAESATP